MAKIELLTNIPVDKAYGPTKGKVLEMHEEIPRRYKVRNSPSVSVIADNGQEVNLYSREFKRLKEASSA